MSRPVIGVTVSRRSGWRIFPLVAFNLWLAGGRGRKWQSGTDTAPDLDDVDGVIIGGGDDISPDLYGGQLVTSARLEPARDALEHDIVADAMERGIPVLGICRGAQMLNVVLGGSLHQDAYGTYTASKHVWTILPRKRVMVTAETRLAHIAGTAPMIVNALHSQAVDRLGCDLNVAARDDGGMIQAVERTKDPFALGVQWHPEHLFYAKRQRAVFRALVNAAAAYKANRSQLKAVDRI
ncbi:gamma-glutamyl-gamma-aminobutyrate hydrolase family protein [Qingshengfaniella alkalisoli]|uniref:Gamma-glutamyl-gamma-aminobutyrate hydrolase family protein n=1 Tax=Qingshengfaniella alkalisoli TaxID=2599296 RepID=A0A5B8J954_9RHOB|nr:gamma-glutamyl-gamma-aminobutyrate hydrolase family protein [Qingshengfaniella alkalisoli]QDY70790.1 gamma-glutamyl-gamma-aminobutyrate hydrolase family protein [Qingshengfaniella alkalisoli]